MKGQPNHTCAVAIDPRHEPVALHPRDMVIGTRRETPHWTEVHTTWGSTQRTTWACADACVDEAYGIVSPEANSPKFAGLKRQHLINAVAGTRCQACEP